jgi:hypothetical protein
MSNQQTKIDVTITQHSTSNMGDHGMETQIAFPYIPDETVEAMVKRVSKGFEQPKWMRHDYADYITIRVVKGTAPHEPTTDGSPF